jgi:hypothetical protein
MLMSRKLLTTEEEERLVSEVLRDLPAEEKGERDEWNQQVGWHRKENVRKRTTQDDNQKNNRRNKARTLPAEQKGGISPEETVVSPLNHLRIRDDFMTSSSASLQFVVVTLIVLGIMTSKILRKRHKGRTL